MIGEPRMICGLCAGTVTTVLGDDGSREGRCPCGRTAFYLSATGSLVTGITDDGETTEELTG